MTLPRANPSALPAPKEVAPLQGDRLKGVKTKREGNYRSVGEATYDEPARCSACGHAAHGKGCCLNLASDNDCDCQEGA